MGPFALVVAAVLVLANLNTPKTTVILLPDEDGVVGSITIKTQGDSRVVDKAFDSVSTAGDAGKLPLTQSLGEQQVKKDYADLLSAQPPKPMSFLLYFDFDSVNLTEASQAQLIEVVDQVKQHMPSEVLLAGHTDATGPEAFNMGLSRERAVTVENFLKSRIPSLEHVEVRYFGPKVPLVPTPQNVAEPRNRRVEIIVY
jgi:outer membrane protein OmpA-like peptidoglycan-associated protein